MMQEYVPQYEMLVRYRSKAIDIANSRVLVTNFEGTQQECDLSAPANCNGFGRVRHFVRGRTADWPSNPLPIDPACHALGLPNHNLLRAQVFQFAACTWRCWYCFVPYNLLDARPQHSAFFSAAELIDLWLCEDNRPPMIDLTGGAPELVPEWVLWMMKELQNRKLDAQTYLWSDDSLSTDLFWTCLSEADREFIASYRNYGRVCCIKGFDEHSFSFNTRAHPEQFQHQFARLRRLVELGLDIYLYATFTSDDVTDLVPKMKHFVDHLQELNENLPLRLVPLRIAPFTPTTARMNNARILAIRHQYLVVEAWLTELHLRFPSEMMQAPIHLVPLRNK